MEAERSGESERAICTFLLVTGATPGLGKTSMVRRLSAELAAQGREVETFFEADIAGRAEFVDVMASFRRAGVASAELLLEATGRLAQTYRPRSSTILVQDMLLPYLPSLLAWGFSDSEILELFSGLEDACTGIQLVQIHIDGSPDLALPRAVAREDDGWLEWMIGKVGRYADLTTPVTDTASLLVYLAAARQRTARLLARAPWRVIVVDADLGEEAALRDAKDGIARILRL